VTTEGEIRETRVVLAGQTMHVFEAGDLFADLNGYSLLIDAGGVNVHPSFLTINTDPQSGGNSPSQTTAGHVSQAGSELLFGYVPGEMVAAVVLEAPLKTVGETALDVTLLDGEGTVAQTTISLQGRNPKAVLVRDLFPELELPAHGGLLVSAADGTKLVGTTFVFKVQGEPSMSAAASTRFRP